MSRSPIALGLALTLAVAAGCMPTPNRAKAPTGFAAEGTVRNIKTTILKGVALAPPGLIANNGGGVISNNSGGVISNNSGGLVSNNGSASYRIQAAPDAWQAVPGAKVTIVDQFHRPVKGIAPVTTDAKGAFSLKNVPIGLNWLVEVEAPKGKLSTLVRPDAAPDALKVTPASTLVTEHLRRAFGDQKVALRQVPLASFDVLTKQVEKVLATDDAVKLDLSSPEKAAQVFDAVAKAHEDIHNEGELLILNTKKATDTAIQLGQITPEDLVEPSVNQQDADDTPGSGGNDQPPAPSNLISSLGGVVTAIAGTGTPGAGANQLNFPSDVVPAPADNTFYVMDKGNHAVKKVVLGATATITRFVGGNGAGMTDETMGDGTTGQLDNPEGLDVDGSGRVFIADTGNHAIRAALTMSGQVTLLTLAGNDTAAFAEGNETTARFNGPTDVVVASDDTLYVSDTGNHCIRKLVVDVAARKATVTTIAGTPEAKGYADGAAAGAKFNRPTGLYMSGNMLYVADSGNNCIRRILLDQGNKVETFAGTGSPDSPGFADGTGVAAKFAAPNGLAMDSKGILYVADGGNHRIRAISKTGEVVSLAGNGTAAFKDGTGTGAQFAAPVGLCFDLSDKLIVADTQNHRLRRIQ